MKRFVVILAALSAATALTACGKTETTNLEAAAPPAAPVAAPPPMDMSSGAAMAKGTGTVTAVSGDTVTIAHAPIPEAKWPAMTMAFRASPDLAKTVKAGDKVAFDLKLQGGAGEITAINKQ